MLNKYILILAIQISFITLNYAQSGTDYSDKYNYYYNEKGQLVKEIHHNNSNNTFDSILYHYNKKEKLIKTEEFLKNGITQTIYVYDEFGVLKKKKEGDILYHYSYNTDGKLVLKLREYACKTDTAEFYQYQNKKLQFEKTHIIISGLHILESYRYSYKGEKITKVESLRPDSTLISENFRIYNNNGTLKSETQVYKDQIETILYFYDKNDSLIKCKEYHAGELFEVQEWTYLKQKEIYKNYFVSDNNLELESKTIRIYNDKGILIEKIYIEAPQFIIIECKETPDIKKN